MNNDRPEPQTHPSYGYIGISRCTGGNQSFFGSPIRHNEFIVIRINEADVTRNLNTDWIHPTQKLIEIRLTPVQFAELLTANGLGVPCTLEWVRGTGRIEDPPFNDKAELFRDEFADQVKAVGNGLSKIRDEIAKLLKEKTIKKKDLQGFVNLLTTVCNVLADSMPFVADMFAEEMEKVVTNAKAEIEAHVLHRALQIAQDGLNLVENREKLARLDLPDISLNMIGKAENS